jgi:hypothetical protein
MQHHTNAALFNGSEQGDFFCMLIALDICLAFQQKPHQLCGSMRQNCTFVPVKQVN